MVLQAPASPFSPAKPPMKAAPRASPESNAPPADVAVGPAVHMPEQMDKKGVNRMLAVAVLTAVGAAVFAGAPATTLTRHGKNCCALSKVGTARPLL